MDAETVTPDLFAKVGPLPAWGWGAIAVGAYMWYSHRNANAGVAATDTAQGTDTGTVAADSTGDPFATPDSPQDAGYNYGDVLAGTYGGTVAASSTPNGGSQFSSNQAWATYAISFMVRQGAPASTTTTAITHYLAGAPLTTAEQGIVSQAITLIGPPPLPLPIVAAQSAPTGAGSTGSTAKLAAPVVQGHSDGSRAQFSWSVVPGARFYLVYRRGVYAAIVYKPTFSSSVQRKGTHYGPITVRAARTNRDVSALSNAVTVTV